MLSLDLFNKSTVEVFKLLSLQNCLKTKRQEVTLTSVNVRFSWDPQARYSEDLISLFCL